MNHFFIVSFFILRMTVLGCGLSFQAVLLACTCNNYTIIILQNKIDTTDFQQNLHTQKVGSTRERERGGGGGGSRGREEGECVCCHSFRT